MNSTLSKVRARRVAGLLAVFVGVIGLVPAAAGAAGSVGNVTFSDAGGGSQAVFSVRPPEGAQCPGDSAHDYYRVNSFLVRKGTAPTKVNFTGGVPSLGYGLIDEGAFFGAVNTERNTGTLFIFPDHSTWSRLTPKNLFPNGEASTVWETGLACADRNGVVKRYWSTEVTFTASTKDPGGFVWRVAGDGVSQSSSNAGLIIAVLAVVIAGVAVAAVVRSRRRPAKPVGLRL